MTLLYLFQIRITLYPH